MNKNKVIAAVLTMVLTIGILPTTGRAQAPKLETNHEQFVLGVMEQEHVSRSEAEKMVKEQFDQLRKANKESKVKLRDVKVQADPKAKAVPKLSKSNITPLTSPTSGNINSGTYPTRYGVMLVTNDGDWGHVGIIWTSTTTIESFPDGGVQRYDNDWNTRYYEVYGVTNTTTTAAQDNEASNRCQQQEGKPYNYSFFNIETRDKYYCSHLVWSAFKDLYGIDVYKGFPRPLGPINLALSTANVIIYKQNSNIWSR